MKCNAGKIDRALRLIVGAVLIVWFQKIRFCSIRERFVKIFFS